ETISSEEKAAMCPLCNSKIIRGEAYLRALRKREAGETIKLASDLNELSEEALYNLEEFINNFSVPSFSVSYKGKIDRSELAELINKKYIEVDYFVGLEEKTIIILNAYKLGLIENKELLLQMTGQATFVK